MAWTLSAFADEAGGATADQIAALSRDGMSLIDPRSVEGYNICDLPLDTAEAFKKQLDDAGISVNMYGSPIGKIDITDDFGIDLQKLDHLAELKKVFDCSAVRMFSYFNKNNAPIDEWRRVAIDRLKQLRDKAAAAGLVLYHENESDIFGDHSDQILEISELRDSESFCLIYDFANFIRTGESGLDTWAKLKDKTDYFHFKDQRINGQHVPMGDGQTDARAILAEARDMGWQGGCTLEPHLSFSDAVLATGVSGSDSASLKDMPTSETFHIAAQSAISLLNELGIEFI